MRNEFVAKVPLLFLLLFLPAAFLTAQSDEKITPRQAYQRAETLFAEGHLFTAPELASLDDLRTRLADAGDLDVVADLDLLRLGATLEAGEEETQGRALVTLAQNAELWSDRETFSQNQVFWRGVRDFGIVTFTLSTISTLLLATVNDRNEALAKTGFYGDSQWDQKMEFSNGMHWAMLGTSSGMFLSLFPLLWGESRQ